MTRASHCASSWKLGTPLRFLRATHVLRLESWDHWLNRTPFLSRLHDTGFGVARRSRRASTISIANSRVTAGCHGKSRWNSRVAPLTLFRSISLRGYMNLNHVHFQVQDLPTAVDWFGLVLDLKPGFQNERIATFIFDAVTIIID